MNQTSFSLHIQWAVMSLRMLIIQGEDSIE